MKTESNANQITALYCRLSQEDMRAGESLSIENQRLMLKDYADKNGFRNCQYYIDDGYSGVDNTRPEYVHMLDDVQNGLVGTVIVKDQSRLGRDHLETDRLMELVFPAYDVRFIAVTDGVDSANGINEMSGIKNLFNDMYARDCSNKIRAVLRAKGERGERLGAWIAYGYMRDPDEAKHIVPNPETAPVVKHIFEMYASGIGIKRICGTLEQEKVLSPGVYNYRKNGSLSRNLKLDKPYAWANNTIRKMLSNQIYCGDTVNFKTYSKSNKLKKRIKNAPEKMKIFSNTHEAIIDRATFDLVQKHFEGRKRADKRGELDKYAGYLYCAECGSRLYRNRDKAHGYDSYRCGHYESRKSDCTSHYIRESVLDEIVLRALKKVTKYAREHSDEFYRDAMKNGEAEAAKNLKESESLRVEYESKIKQLDNAIQLLYMDRSNGKITDERYELLSASFENEHSELKSKLNELSTSLDEIKVREKLIRDFINAAKQCVTITRVTPELLRTFVKRIEVHEKAVKRSRTCGNHIVIYFTFHPDKAFRLDGEMNELGITQFP
ncbi:MAG TPA: recombinase family protein [Ruminococcus sp.]|nr:recombinase family protein [Ruminococcus sp.]HRU98429.1 recombinase family protein [Ruminococcus sp.]